MVTNSHSVLLLLLLYVCIINCDDTNTTTTTTSSTTITVTTATATNDATVPHCHCRDPDFGSQLQAHRKSERKYLLIGGKGAGIGNFLIFYPSAYFFAALTGRAILIIDDSLIGLMCTVLSCGFPLYNEVTNAFPSLFNGYMHPIDDVKGIKVHDIYRHLNGEEPLGEHYILRADGFKQFSGWYLGRNDTSACIAKITNCEVKDINCHERYAFSKLVRGPFKVDSLVASEEKRLAGVPANLRRAMMTLPHAYAPRLDAAVHLRCQFDHFERLIGPEDTAYWADAVKEMHNWMNSTSPDAGHQVFKAIEEKIMEDLTIIKSQQSELTRSMMRARSLQTKSNDSSSSSHHHTSESDEEIEALTFAGDAGDDRIYIYIAADNDFIKEEFVKYLKDHAKIAVMRIKNKSPIAHAKNIDYLQSSQNKTGLMDLVVDWYSLSLANVVYSWRRNTDMISTFAQSAQHFSRRFEHGVIHDDEESGIGSNGYQLFFKGNGNKVWREYW